VSPLPSRCPAPARGRLAGPFRIRRVGPGAGRTPGVLQARAARLAAAVAAAALLAAGCGSTASPAAPAPPRTAALPLATSAAGDQATWAAIPMGTTGPNLFWQLFVLPSHGTRWTLATPPDVATNGAFALAPGAGTSLVAGIGPSLLLRFSPITSTPDAGRTWSAGTPDPGLASVPDALAAAPEGGRLIALERTGGVETGTAGSGGTGTAGTSGSAASSPAPPWARLTSAATVARTPAGRACQLSGLTAAAFSPAGTAMLAGQCGRPGVAGIFASQGQGWQAAGPALPAALRGQRIEVLRLTRAGNRLTALLQAGAGRTASMIAAWDTAGGHWTLSPPLALHGLAVQGSSFGTSSLAVNLAGRHGELLAGPGASWQPLPELPAGRALILALPSPGIIDALAASGSKLTAWQLHAGSGPPSSSAAAYGPGTWTRTQQTTVPIQYGSSA
jgi:hypothetical protein